MTVDNKSGGNKSAKPNGADAVKQAEMDAVWRRIEQKAKPASNGPTTGKKKLPAKELAFRIIVPIFAVESVLLVVLLVAMLVGTIGFSAKAPVARTVSVYNVCSDLVDQYNNLLTGDYTNSDTTYADGIAAIADEINQREHTDRDATCQYLLIQANIQAMDGQQASQALDTYESLIDEGINPSPNLINLQSTSSLETSIKAATGELSNPDDGADGVG